jgi:cobalt-zinc-cadmium efflux system protein
MMGAGHDHTAGAAGNERALLTALALTGGFMVAEVVAGLWFNSLALLSDAAHMFTDVTALGIAIAAIRIARRPADRRRTYGYHRFEVLAAAFNASLLFLVAMYILWEAVQRFRAPAEVQSFGMLLVALGGLAVNAASMRILRGRGEGSLNVKGAYLEVWADLLGSLGVVAAALVIRFTGWSWVDPLVGVAIGFWVLPRTWILLRESTNVLLEGVPEGFDLDVVEQALLALPGVTGVHDLHVWSLSSGRIALTAHVEVDDQLRQEKRLEALAEKMLAERFHITHAVVQIELPKAHTGAELIIH